jgi:hypothetical protein
MNDVLKAHERSVQGMQSALTQASADYQSAQAIGDLDGMAQHEMTIAGLRATLHQMAQMEREHAAPPAPLVDRNGQELREHDANLCRRYRLTPADLETAKGWTADHRLSDQEKVETYLKNRARYQDMRATGRYRDDQGLVRR